MEDGSSESLDWDDLNCINQRYDLEKVLKLVQPNAHVNLFGELTAGVWQVSAFSAHIGLRKARKGAFI